MPTFIFLLNVISTWYMVGLIWMVQIVHYPLFSRVATENYVEYQELHQRWITPVVGVPMLIEIATALMMLNQRPKEMPAVWVWAALVLLAIIWLSTAFLQIPCHNQLSQAFDANAHSRLVNTNWIRTIAWTARGCIVAWFAYCMMQPSQ
jgi:hypothetical protein